jgi:hypothetical protein
MAEKYVEGGLYNMQRVHVADPKSNPIPPYPKG